MKSELPSKHKNLMLIILVAVFVVPIALAKIIIDSGIAKALPTKEHGIIIQPAINLNATENLKSLTENGLSPGEWIGIYFDNGSCDEYCQREIQSLESVKKVLGKDHDRFHIGIFISQISTKLDLDTHITLVGGPRELQELTEILASRIDPYLNHNLQKGVIVIDWRGYMMLYYPELVQYGFKKDISKLLRGSRIR